MEIDIISLKFELFLLYFFIYSFLGWIIEVSYVYFTSKKLVNRGFLFGPFVPIYGFGTIAILSIDNFLSNIGISFAEKILIYTILATGIEYIGAFLLENIFNIKLWDYSNRFLNLHGRICALYSLYWAVLSIILLKIIHPFINNIIQYLDFYQIISLNFLLSFYMISDTIITTLYILNKKGVFSQLYLLLNLDNSIEKYKIQVQRLKNQYKDVIYYKYITHKNKVLSIKNTIDKNIKEIYNSIIK